MGKVTFPAGEQQQYYADGSAGEKVKGRGGGGDGGGSEIDLICTGELPCRRRGRSRRRDIYFTQDGQGAGGRGEPMVVNSKNVAVFTNLSSMELS